MPLQPVGISNICLEQEKELSTWLGREAEPVEKQSSKNILARSEAEKSLDVTPVSPRSVNEKHTYKVNEFRPCPVASVDTCVFNTPTPAKGDISITPIC